VRRNCEADVTVAASPEAVWAVISDVTRVGEWSGECRGCVWVGGADAPRPGARFKGRNRRGGLRWSRLNEVVQADSPHAFVWRTVARAPYFDSSEWRVSLTEDGTGTRVSESFQVLTIPRLMERLVWLAMPAHRDRTADLVDDLARLKMLVESDDRKSGHVK
jgi:uncharacterized protein YndB with AHSA1/START domain